MFILYLYAIRILYIHAQVLYTMQKLKTAHFDKYLRW